MFCLALSSASVIAVGAADCGGSSPVTARASRVGSSRSCDARVPTGRDVARILGAPVRTAHLVPGDSETCELGSGESRRIFMSLRPGLGRLTVQSWVDGKMPLAAWSLGGVGDRALWQPELNEVIAERGDLLCDVAVARPAGGGVEPSRPSLPIRLGTLCNKVFASGR